MTERNSYENHSIAGEADLDSLVLDPNRTLTEMRPFASDSFSTKGSSNLTSAHRDSNSGDPISTTVYWMRPQPVTGSIAVNPD